ncbi:MAG: hypothetical protein R2771_02030 [Saprospiraceae bacterium]
MVIKSMLIPQYFSTDNVSFNIAPNPTTGYYFGDNNGDGTYETGGAPIEVGPAGFYYIEMDNTPHKVEEQNWAVTGSAVNNQIVPLTWDSETEQLVVETNIVPGDLYFTVIGNSDITMGDDDANGILKPLRSTYKYRYSYSS